VTGVQTCALPIYRLAIKELREKYPDDIILITGSLAFAALARRYLLGLKP
jgi:hypothetical protein